MTARAEIAIGQLLATENVEVPEPLAASIPRGIQYATSPRFGGVLPWLVDDAGAIENHPSREDRVVQETG